MPKVLHNQSLIDLAIQHTGNVENCFAIAMENGMAISDFLDAGSEVFIPGTLTVNNDILNYYNSKQIKPATGFVETSSENELEGISIWILNKNFVVQ